MKFNLKHLDFATVVTIYYITVITILGELYSPIKIGIANIGGHHWVGKGLTALALYFLIYVGASIIEKKTDHSLRIGKATIFAPIVSMAILLVFFIFEYSQQ